MRINSVGHKVNFGRGYFVCGPKVNVEKMRTVFSTPEARSLGYKYIDATDFLKRNLDNGTPISESDEISDYFSEKRKPLRKLFFDSLVFIKDRIKKAEKDVEKGNEVGFLFTTKEESDGILKDVSEENLDAKIMADLLFVRASERPLDLADENSIYKIGGSKFGLFA